MSEIPSTAKIELIYDQDCPNVPQARDALRRALDSLGLQRGWEEWERSDAGCPEYAQNLGSPSILVNAVDVSPSADNDSSCCRVYPENAQFRGCPSVENIVEALRRVS